MERLGSPAIPESELTGLAANRLTATGLSGAANTVQPPFAQMLGDLVAEVNARQMTSSAAVNGLLSGQDVPLHQAVIAMEEASVSFQLMVEVRNRMLESYQELMRMQI